MLSKQSQWCTTKMPLESQSIVMIITNSVDTVYPVNMHTVFLCHYGDVIMCAIAYKITRWPLFTQPFIQTQTSNIKAPRHWPLCGDFTGDRWTPHINGQWRGKCFHWMTSSCTPVMVIIGVFVASCNIELWCFRFMVVFMQCHMEPCNTETPIILCHQRLFKSSFFGNFTNQ